jgi:hypothetical protein
VPAELSDGIKPVESCKGAFPSTVNSSEVFQDEDSAIGGFIDIVTEWYRYFGNS